jgi:acyl carrier protein
MRPTVSDVTGRVRTIVASVLRVPIDTLDLAASPDTIASWDSLNHMQLVLALEEHFGLQFAVEEMEAMQSVGGIIAILSERIGERA